MGRNVRARGADRNLTADTFPKLSVYRLPAKLMLVQPVGFPRRRRIASPFAVVDIGVPKDYRQKGPHPHMSVRYAPAPSGDVGTPDATLGKGLNNRLSIVASTLFVTGVLMWTAAVFIYQRNTGDESVTSFMVTLRLKAEHVAMNPLSVV